MTTPLKYTKGLPCAEFPAKGRPRGRVRQALDESVAENRYVSFTVAAGEQDRMRNRISSAASRAGYETRIRVFMPEVPQGNRKDGTRALVTDPTRRIVEVIARIRPCEVGDLQVTGPSAGST